MRKLLVSMNRWITDGVEPPPSAYPRLDHGTLVPPDKLKFPKIPSVNVPTTPHKAYRADYGPEFISKGIVSQEPPKVGSAFPILVPQVDADGNEIAGIRVPELAVPLATLRGLEPLQRAVRPDQRRLQHAGLFHSASAYARRTRAYGRSASIDRRSATRAAISISALVVQGRERSGAERLPAEGRRSARRRTGRHAVGLRNCPNSSVADSELGMRTVTAAVVIAGAAACGRDGDRDEGQQSPPRPTGTETRDRT